MNARLLTNTYIFSNRSNVTNGGCTSQVSRKLNVSYSRVSVVIVGCGNRGQKYARYHTLYPQYCQVVAIAGLLFVVSLSLPEPRPGVRKVMQERYSLDAPNVFSGLWRFLLR
jgi:hypothetical protein